MQKLACEMCGSTNIVKQDGLYVCQSCGTKYSPEEARKMMTEGTVDVKGIVKVDTSSDITNLKRLLNRAKNNQQWKEVADYANKILEKDPDDWEAVFNKELGEAYSCSFENQSSEFMDLITASENSIRIIENNNVDVDLKKVKTDFVESINELCVTAYKATINNYANTKSEASVYALWNAMQSDITLSEFALNLTDLDDGLKSYIYENIINYSTSLVKPRSYIWGYYTQNGNDKYKTLNVNDQIKKEAESKYNEYVAKIKVIKPEFAPPKMKTNNGCYIATSVYGSYDCPEVWTLRRYRDNYLNKSLPGKLFIKIYYKTSPTIVKWFGDKKWFNQIFKNRLDKKVEKLQEKGFESTFYYD